MNACEITASITALANMIANEFDDECLGLLSVIFVQLGDTLATILTAKQVCR